MRLIFGVLALLVALGVVAQLARTQLAATRTERVVPAAGEGAASPGGGAVVSPRHQPQEVKRAVEGLMQQARPMPEDKP
ncbi:hypothetical protein [Ramlibacter rhizophilus]|uniref:Uncharacterized protein n=1 Tax=Ramlibacter rhizophilus TaxID=1781167 RepID=A0A4Z0C1Y1_9BURK|nr:hypothetical protein [Ramlibacter rhizophilus]TFZ04952.1 hypothetical protein EZ242_04175 [Ramlibacter rhizophilus]